MNQRPFTLLQAVALCALLHALLLADNAWGQDPTFKYGDQKEVKDVSKVEWKASAQAGLVLTTGNSETTTLSGGIQSSRKTGNNKFLFAANGAYARSTLLLVNDENGDGILQDDEIIRERQTTARGWVIQGRYDRFLSELDSLYLTGIVSSDVPAGKDLVVGAQLGYSRRLLKNERNEVVAEVGYDLSYEDPVIGDGQGIHSARLFLGYQGKLTDVTGFIGSIEFLGNLNSLDNDVGAFDDTRLNTVAAITTKLFEDINLRVGVTSKYDNAPSLNPLSGRPADKLDTRTEAVIVVNFL